jgi:hypothetical protein
MKMAIKMFPMFFRAGGWIALAGLYLIPTFLSRPHYLPATHYHFIHEIPMFKPYEIQAKLAAWDHKWVRTEAISAFIRL